MPGDDAVAGEQAPGLPDDGAGCAEPGGQVTPGVDRVPSGLAAQSPGERADLLAKGSVGLGGGQGVPAAPRHHPGA